MKFSSATERNGEGSNQTRIFAEGMPDDWSDQNEDGISPGSIAGNSRKRFSSKQKKEKRKLMKSTIAALTGALLLAGTLFAGSAGRTASSAQDPTPAPDNTKVNKTERDKGQPSAGDQKENKADRNTTQQIRRAVMKDKSLSMYAHNVKIITQDGMVTLKGPVRSEEEKKSIESKAKQVAGDDKVTDELEVKQ